jgi:hypothetical protein
MEARALRRTADSRRIARRTGAWAIAATTLLALSACFPCDGVALAFADHPLIVRGTWTGMASSSVHPDIEVRLSLDAAFVDDRTYAVTGVLELDGGVALEVRGAGYGFCEQRFETTGAVVVATPAPEAPRFTATLYDANGAPRGSLLAYRILGAEDDGNMMRGELRLASGSAERVYVFDVERPAAAGHVEGAAWGSAGPQRLGEHHQERLPHARQ